MPFVQHFPDYNSLHTYNLPQSSTPTTWASRARITSSALQIRTLFLKSGMSSWSSTKKKSSKGVRNFQDKHSASQIIFVCVTFSQCLVNPKILSFVFFFFYQNTIIPGHLSFTCCWDFFIQVNPSRLLFHTQHVYSGSHFLICPIPHTSCLPFPSTLRTLFFFCCFSSISLVHFSYLLSPPVSADFPGYWMYLSTFRSQSCIRNTKPCCHDKGFVNFLGPLYKLI